MKKNLSGKELEKVNGGFDGYDITERRYNFTAGDTFADNSSTFQFYVVERSYTAAKPNDRIPVAYYLLSGNVYHLSWNTLYLGASTFENGCTFLGNNYLEGAVIVKDERPKDI